MNSHDLQRCLEVTQRLGKFPCALLFKNPVDRASLPHYYQKITNPMDLESVTRKLKNNKYRDVSEWESDFDLIRKNCYKFNQTDSPPRLLVQQMMKRFKKLKKTYFTSHSVEELTAEYCALSLKLDRLLTDHPQNPELREFEAFDVFKEVEPTQVVSLSELQKALSNCVSQEQQIQILYLIRELEPRYCTGTTEIEIDLNQLKPETIEKLHQFLASQ
jgi:hypothetical protein